MLHPRTDYQGIQDTTGETSIGENEPVFLLRAQDRLAPDTLIYWASQLKASGGDVDTANNIIKFAERMRIWQLTHNVKIPDAPKDTLLL